MSANPHARRALRPRTLRWLIIAWASFVPAAVATMVFFATFDPVEIARHATHPMEIDRMPGYGIGFLCFWALTAAAAWAATFLLRSVAWHHPEPDRDE